MFRRISRQERERRAARAELETTLQALRSNERAFTEAQDPFYIDQLTYQHAALMCRCRALLRTRHVQQLCLHALADQLVQALAENIRAPQLAGVGLKVCQQAFDKLLPLLLTADGG